MKEIRVYKHWAEPASAVDHHRLQSQLKLAYQYRRMLAMIENAARVAQRALVQADPAIAMLINQLAVLHEADPPATIVITAAQEALRLARRDLHKTDAYKLEARAIGDRRQVLVRGARGLFSAQGLAWGTYQHVEEAHDQSCSENPYWEDVKVRLTPGFGAIAVHIQNRVLPSGTLVGGRDTFVQIDAERYGLSTFRNGWRAIDPDGPSGRVQIPAGERRPCGGGAPRLQRIRIRTGSDGRAPIWTEFHMLLHRPLPPGKILWVRAHQTRVGIRTMYNIQFVVDIDTAGRAPRARPAGGAVMDDRAPQARSHHVGDATDDRAPQARSMMSHAIVGVDIGWRKLENGDWRVAMAVIPDGTTDELVVPHDVLRRADKSADLRSIRDQSRDAMRTRLLAFRETVVASLEDATPAPSADWLEATRTMHAWLKFGRFVRLRHWWAQHRFAGDEEIYSALCAWLDNDRHLIDWQEFNIRRMKRQIDGLYQAWAMRLARSFDVIAIEDMNLTDLKASSPGLVSDLAHERGMVVGLSHLIGWLKRATAGYNTRLVEVDPAYTTRNCRKCGFCRPASAELVIKCEACGFAEDQDITAGHNITARAVATLEEPTPEATPVKRRVRRTRRRPNEATTEPNNG